MPTCVGLIHFPRNLESADERNFKKVLIPELNMGQLRSIIRSEFLIDAVGLNKVQGKPFTVAEILEKISEVVAS